MLKNSKIMGRKATMNFILSGPNRILISFLCFVGLVSCVLTLPNETKKDIPVSWTTAYTMPKLLATSDISLNNTSDLLPLIEASWYAKIEVNGTKIGATKLSSCKNYFDNAKPSTRTIRDNEMSAYIELKIMCEATSLLINAIGSKKSFLPRNVLNNESPKLWPKEIALQISTQESKHSNQNPNLKTWNDVTPIIKYEPQSKTSAIFHHEGGYQEVGVLGRGDANNDGIEDVFIIVQDHVRGGDYFNIRLFVLSVNTQGDWELIKNI